MTAIFMDRNGKESSINKINHFNARSFYQGQNRERWHQTEVLSDKNILAGPFNKPLQGHNFWELWEEIMNVSQDMTYDDMDWDVQASKK